MYLTCRESMCTEISCTGHQMVILLINLAYAVPAPCFWHEPPSSNSSGMVKILTGLSLDSSIERMRELPAQEDYVIADTRSFIIIMKDEKWICLSSQCLRWMKLYFQYRLEVFSWVRGGTCRAHFCLISKREMFKCTLKFLFIVKELISVVRLEL